MTRARSVLLLGAALTAGVVTAGLSILLGLDLPYVPTVGMGAFLVVITGGMVALLPHDEPLPIARATPAPASVRKGAGVKSAD